MQYNRVALERIYSSMHVFKGIHERFAVIVLSSAFEGLFYRGKMRK